LEGRSDRAASGGLSAPARPASTCTCPSRFHAWQGSSPGMHRAGGSARRARIAACGQSCTGPRGARWCTCPRGAGWCPGARTQGCVHALTPQGWAPCKPGRHARGVEVPVGRTCCCSHANTPSSRMSFQIAPWPPGLAMTCIGADSSHCPSSTPTTGTSGCLRGWVCGGVRGWVY